MSLGRRIASRVESPLVLSLEGPLGAGKTCFVKGLADGLGIGRDAVSSPTFTLVHEYSNGRIPLIHFDLYRLESEEELLPLGFEEYLRTPGIVAIEWGGKFSLPRGAWRVAFEIEPDGRKIRASLVP